MGEKREERVEERKAGGKNSSKEKKKLSHVFFTSSTPPFLGVDSKIDGWMSHVHTWAANFLTMAQHERGIYGAVGKLGEFFRFASFLEAREQRGGKKTHVFLFPLQNSAAI